ncbi:flavin-containing monooxygenase [Allokutzneria albata]|uniref:Predicted flavoprotein CzcO associated with the cation diffusion facilitator CzcD n=1 Tax=Allokutzneria albata TaxID=211114 RepID=A0A1G9X7M4_ALLAB|nr:NAD(P)-binding domain-containing protein [Allokutzneria albata]SDM92744.1 Predicted flavoprotein CzcO associated with the cation diffusion facilitator CzcD [Allokutzneria albata]
MTKTVCVIGAGSSGLVALKNLRQAGFDAVAYERHDEVGGNWCFGGPGSRVYASTHTISSKPFTQYPDFPMPDEWPDYPHHSRLREYFQRYAEHFRLLDHVRFGHEVTSAVPDGGGWSVTVKGKVPKHFDALVVANGHNWHPKMPEYPGLAEFSGKVLHSAAYKGPDVLRGQRVLVVGAGNTGCDIAVEAAQHAEAVWHSTRRGYWYVPKYILGKPSDQIADALIGLRLPKPVRRLMTKLTLLATVGLPQRAGLPKPDHALFETHPIVNSLLTYYVGHGGIKPVPDVERFEGSTVVLSDGQRVDVDLVVLATGYLLRVPFLDPALLAWDGEAHTKPKLYQHVFSPAHETLFVAGLIQPDSGQFALVHWQTAAIASYLRARDRSPSRAAAFRRTVVQQADRRWTGGQDYVKSTRHHFEVAHQHYLRGLQSTIDALGAA